MDKLHNPVEEQVFQHHYQHSIRKMLDNNEHVTPVRDRILRVLCMTSQHLTSREILQELSNGKISVSRTSVFRTLDLFVRLGIIRPTYVESQTPSYVLLTEGGNHAHIICPRCNSVQEMEDFNFDLVQAELESKYARQISGQLLECYSVCPDCSE